MKKNILIMLVILIGISFIACDETTNPIEEKGTINVSSTPIGAQIWLDGDSTGTVTPGSVEATAGFHDITLKLDGYSDLTISHISVEAEKETLISENTTLLQLGSLNIESEPAGAEIWLNGSNSGEITPSTFTALSSGNYEITLKLGALGDSTLATVSVSDGARTDVSTQLKFGFDKFGFGTAIKIYETYGTPASLPSGIDLSSGNTYGTSDATNRGNIDLYYFSNSDGSKYLVQSANKHSKMTRETFFKVTDKDNLEDGINSTTKNSSWTSSISDRATNYVFILDADGNYSKLKIVNYHSGTGGDPSWIEVAWIYNKVLEDTSF